MKTHVGTPTPALDLAARPPAGSQGRLKDLRQHRSSSAGQPPHLARATNTWVAIRRYRKYLTRYGGQRPIRGQRDSCFLVFPQIRRVCPPPPPVFLQFPDQNNITPMSDDCRAAAMYTEWNHSQNDHCLKQALDKISLDLVHTLNKSCYNYA